MATGATEFIDNTIATSVFSPPVWSKQVLEVMDANYVAAKLVNRQFEADAKVGISVAIPSISALSARAKSENTAITFETASESVKTITMNQWYYAAFGVEDLVKLQSQVDLRAKYQKRAGMAIVKNLDSAILALVQGFSQTQGTLGTPFSDDNVLRAIQYIEDADADGSIVGIMSPAEKKDKFTLDRWTSKDFRDSSPVETGKLGNVYGVDWYMTTNLYKASANQADNVIMNGDAIGLVVQQEPRPQTFYDLKYFTWQVAIDIVYGVAELRDTFGVWLKGVS